MHFAENDSGNLSKLKQKKTLETGENGNQI